jgi:hypothetical protein
MTHAVGCSNEKLHVWFVYTSQEVGIAVEVVVGSDVDVGGIGDGVSVGGTDVGTGAEAEAHPLAKTVMKTNMMTNKIDFFMCLSSLIDSAAVSAQLVHITQPCGILSFIQY